MVLVWNASTQEYVVTATDKKRPEEAGLTLSTNIRGPKGELVYFTQDGYAALPFYKDAVGAAKARLAKLYSDYEQSWLQDWDTAYPVGQRGSTLKLRGYQNAGVAYGLAHTNVLIGDEMGIG